MTPANAIRWLHHQARTCRDRDSSEAFCLLLPALLRLLDLDPMEDVEAAAFRHEFKLRLRDLPFQDAADRTDGGAQKEAVTTAPVWAISQMRSPVTGTGYADNP
ncbi:MAG TPA: hypothetical protein VGV18_05580 [Verrucomicrobiae bacterium]|nr:hypothetical protein [Verrucomicrobiae bacterium]